MSNIQKPIIERSKFIHIPKCGGTSIKEAFDAVDDKYHECYWCMKNKYGLDYWEKQFVFAFIRNPFDRMASFYRYLYKKDKHDIQSDRINFEDWFHLTLVEKKRPYYYNRLFFSPAYTWLVDPDTGKVEVDFIGKVESFQQDFRDLCRLLGTSRALPKKNVSDKSIETNYTSDMKQEMLTLFKPDIEIWYPESKPKSIT